MATDLLRFPLTGSHLYYGDNLEILRNHIPDEVVDLVYLDPPFNSKADYAILFKAPSGEPSQAQIEAFEDTWHWSTVAEQAFDEVMQSGNTDAAEVLRAIRTFLKENDMMAYLTMMSVRLLELHRVLKTTGSIYLHCDPKASHYLKIIMDAVFGALNFRSEIVWQRTGAHSGSKRYAPVHDIILYYQKSKTRTWNDIRVPYDAAYLDKYYHYDDGDGRLYWKADITGAGVRTGESGKPWRGFDPGKIQRHWAIPKEVIAEAVGAERAATMTSVEKLEVLDGLGAVYLPAGGGMPQYKRYRHQLKGVALGDVWTDVDRINPVGKERLGYPTQKPVALLERILAASSNPDDVVLDPFCGCGTTIHAAQKMGRKWIGIDVTHLAISLIDKRLKDAFPGVSFAVHGTPKDLGGAQALADADKYQFQWWAVSLVDAVPYGGKKKGADGGIDGIIYFKPDGKTTERAIVSVKGGANVGVSMVKDLVTTVGTEKAKIGVFITLAKPTKPMLAEAVKAGFYDSPHHGRAPRIQILTVEELMAGKKPQVPMITAVFKKADREQDAQPTLI